MYYIKIEELLLKNEIVLYNNLASIGEFTGRLTSVLQVYPTPIINWDFEFIGDDEAEPKLKESIRINFFRGEQFSISSHKILSGTSVNTTVATKFNFSGFAVNSIIGDTTRPAHTLNFYLPNMRALARNVGGQNLLVKIIKPVKSDDKNYGAEGGGRSVSVYIADHWLLRLFTEQVAIDWLESTKNTGTLLTTTGQLTSWLDIENQKRDNPKIFDFTDSTNILHWLGLFLSFANGGYTYPLYIEGIGNTENQIDWAYANFSNVTPLELLGETWLDVTSNIKVYIECFFAFLKMMNMSYWQNAFQTIIDWYFQTIQPQNLRSSKPWQVSANALGATFEILYDVIFVTELGRSSDKPLRVKIEEILLTIGISPSSNYDDLDQVEVFKDIRNDATHSQKRGDYSQEKLRFTLALATQWVEEIILWRIGYDGKYRDRTHEYAVSIDPRYDLNTRLSTW